MITLQYLVLGTSYLGFGLGYLPGLRMNRAAIAIVGSAFAVALGMLDLKTAWRAIDPSTIVFLLGMIVVNSALGASGFFSTGFGSFNSLHSFSLRDFGSRYFWQWHSLGIFSQRHHRHFTRSFNPNSDSLFVSESYPLSSGLSWRY